MNDLVACRVCWCNGTIKQLNDDDNAICGECYRDAILRMTEADRALDRAEALLKRLRGWDMMDFNKIDGDYWRSEIDKVLKA